MDVNFKYADEEDKCYGITGMAISMVVFDSDDVLSAITLETSADESIEFLPQYYFSGDPRVSAKAAWTQIVENYQTSMGMVIANVMCRNYVYHRSSMDGAMRMKLLNLLKEEGRDTCSLEDDEIEQLFDKTYGYLHRLFNHHAVQDIAREFASYLKNNRRMSRSDVLEHLRALSML